MKKIHTALLAATVLCGLGTGAWAATEERLMPNVHLLLPSEEVFSVSEFLPSGNWVLLVVDTTLPAGRACLEALTSKQDSFSENLWIVVLGNAKELSQQMKNYEKLSGVRWLHTDSSVLRQLRLPGAPALLGMTSGRQIAWQHAGVPHSPEQLPIMVKNWIGQSLASPSSGTNQ